MFIPNMINYKTRKNVLKEFLNCHQVLGFLKVFADFMKTAVLQKYTKESFVGMF